VLSFVAVGFAVYGLLPMIRFEFGRGLAAEGVAICLCLLALWLSPDDWRTGMPK
jgi:hypothetical protein